MLFSKSRTKGNRFYCQESWKGSDFNPGKKNNVGYGLAGEAVVLSNLDGNKRAKF